MLYLTYPAWINPEIIPGLPVRWYGFMYLVAFAIAYLLVMKQVRTDGLRCSEDTVSNYFLWAILGVIIGARIFATIVYDTSGRYLERPWLVFWPFDDAGNFTGLQGMSYHGGLIGAVIATIIFCRVNRIDFFAWGDVVAAAVPLGYTFGRLGNFINGELYGRITPNPIGMVFPDAQKFPASEPWVQEVARKVGIPADDPNALLNLPRFPSQLFEALFEGIVLWAVLWFIIRRRKRYNGFVLGSYIIGYGAIRFFLEYLREPDIGIGYPIRLGSQNAPTYLFESFLNFSTGQILCFLMVVGGFVLLAIARRRPRADHPVEAQPAGTPASARNAARRARKKRR